MTELNFSFHPGQLEVFQDPRRFKVVVAGRRWGKTRKAAICLLIEGLKEESGGFSVKDKDVYYVAPTLQQGKDNIWRMIKDLGRKVIEQAWENTGDIQLINGRRIGIRGSDRPDTLRGVGLSYAVLDEFASMKPNVWEEIIRPSLADVKGGALFIGTPAGKNHFYELYMEAQKQSDWGAWEFKSIENPFLDAEEIEAARNSMSHESFRQEFEASFSQGGGQIFTSDMFITRDEPPDGVWYLAFDPAGYNLTDIKQRSKLKRMDESALACVKVGTFGWYVGDVKTGRWDIERASAEILNACREYQPIAVGIERGALRNAILPYLNDLSRRLGVFPNLTECIPGTKSGGGAKQARIQWALQGRMQHGRILFKEGPYLKKLMDQAVDFPNPMAHDDMLDALAYIDQVAKVGYWEHEETEFEPLDEVSGY